MRPTYPLRAASPTFIAAARRLLALATLALCAGTTHASVFYRFDIVAQSGTGGIVSLGTGPSINDKGKVAYVGRFATGPSVFAWSPLGGSTDIAPGFLSPNRSFGEAARINRHDEVLAWNRLLPLGLYEVRVFRSGTPNDSSVMVRGISGGNPYDLLYQNPAMNSTRVLEDRATALPGNKDGVCDAGETCVPQVAFNAFRAIPARYLGTPVLTPQDAADVGLRNEYGLNTSQSKPAMADDGRIVIRGVNSGDPILLFDYDLNPPVTIASSATGFTTLGVAPGITPDGKIVAFAADRGHGPGIFLSIQSGAARKVFRIAGENGTVKHAELGVDGANNPIYFSSFDIDSRVGVIYTPDSQGVANKSVVVSFIGTPNAASRDNPGTGKPFLFSDKKGLWTLRIDLAAETYRDICVLKSPGGGALPTMGGDDGFVSLPGGQQYISAGGNGVCETENTHDTETLFSRASPLPVVQVGDRLGAGGAHVVSDIAVHDPIAQANFDGALAPRTARQGEHRVTFFASVDAGASQMIVAGDHLDSDQDGLLDHWEINGIDLEGTGAIDLDLPGMGANPFKRDLFMQLDWTADRPAPLNFGLKHRPTAGLIRRLAQFYATAPARADGVVAGIQLHVDAGTGLDPAGQPFSRNMGVGTLHGGNTLPGGPVDILYFGTPGSVTVPGINAVSFDTAKSTLLWSNQRGAREFAFMHVIYSDFHHATDATGQDNNPAPLQAPVLSGTAFDATLPPAFASASLYGKAIKITSGTGAGQLRAVVSQYTDGVTGNGVINVSQAWTTPPDATSTIVPFDRSSGEGNAAFRVDGAFLRDAIS